MLRAGGLEGVVEHGGTFWCGGRGEVGALEEGNFVSTGKGA